MGLLDDAIREHLDLKRARGADPAEIERMEREALGPVRREPAIGATLYETPDEYARHEYERGFDDEPLTELEELQELGYNDSTAPHLHPHQQHVSEHHHHATGHLDFDHEPLEAEGLYTPAPPEEVEPPKRRFLRRSRHESAPEPPASDLSAGGPFPQDHADDVVERAEPAGSATPPHLQFEHPPKRPRFTAEPPSPGDDLDDEPGASPPLGGAPEPVHAEPVRAEPVRAEPQAPESAPPADPPVANPPETQETTEFDVERHLTEAQHAGQEEDVLEETPEFLQDTPEHDRLWFEQRPPRDFDFDG